jgi:cobalamin biosynthesis protein CobD/CbiB
MNWLSVRLTVVGLIQASNVSLDAGAKASAYRTVGCAISFPSKYSDAPELDTGWGGGDGGGDGGGVGGGGG